MRCSAPDDEVEPIRPPLAAGTNRPLVAERIRPIVTRQRPSVDQPGRQAGASASPLDGEPSQVEPVRPEPDVADARRFVRWYTPSVLRTPGRAFPPFVRWYTPYRAGHGVEPALGDDLVDAHLDRVAVQLVLGDRLPHPPRHEALTGQGRPSEHLRVPEPPVVERADLRTARPRGTAGRSRRGVAAMRPVQSASTNRNASASDAATPAAIACAFDPADPSRRITFAPAAAAMSPVPSPEPSSMTMTSRTC